MLPDVFRTQRKEWYVVAFLCVVCALIWSASFALTPSGVLRVAVLDVGQGDAIYIESPTGERIVIDGGPDDSLLRELPRVMPFFARSIDVIIESHPHADHIAGFVSLIERNGVGVFIEPGIPATTEEMKTFLSTVSKTHVSHYIARRGMWLEIGGGAVLRVLAPDFDTTHLPEKKIHDGMLVVQLIYGSTKVLFMGDADKALENRLVALEGRALKSDVLKVGHHGSRTSTGDTLVSYVSPQYAVISLGKRNIYRFPNKEPLATLEKNTVLTLRTDTEGTVVFESDGTTVTRVQ